MISRALKKSNHYVSANNNTKELKIQGPLYREQNCCTNIGSPCWARIPQGYFSLGRRAAIGTVSRINIGKQTKNRTFVRFLFVLIVQKCNVINARFANQPICNER